MFLRYKTALALKLLHMLILYKISGLTFDFCVNTFRLELLYLKFQSWI